MIVNGVRRFLYVLQAWPRWRVIAASLVTLAAIGVLDFVSGTELNVATLYILPIMTMTWVVGPRWTVPTAVVAAATMFAAEYLAGVQYVTPVIPLWNTGSRLAVFLVVARLVAHLRRTADGAASQARTDPLTGIGNVRFFREMAEHEIARAQRYHDPITVVFIDVDDFKRINDTLGHKAGDRALEAIGQALVEHVRTTDVVARIGGDEFVVLLPMMAAEDARSFLQNLRQRLADHVEASHGPLTCSLGAVTFETPPASVDDLLKQADECRYAAKLSGKDTIRHRVAQFPADIAVVEPRISRLSA